jgi:hypothetical protein
MKHLLGVTATLILGALVLAGTAGATKPYMERVVQGRAPSFNSTPTEM